MVECKNNTLQGSASPVATVSAPSAQSQAMQSAVLYLLFLANAFGNIFICWAISRTKSLRQKPNALLLVSLAISDLCQLFFITFRLTWLYDIETATMACEAFSVFLVILLYVSVLHMCLLSCDRYAAIIYPLLYKTISTTGRVRGAVVVAWTAPLISLGVMSPLLHRNENMVFTSSILGCSVLCTKTSVAHQVHLIFNTSVFVAIPFLVMIFVHCRIAVISWQQTSRIEPGEHLNPEMRRLRIQQKKEMKWMRTIAIVVGAFTIGFIPTFISAVVMSKQGPSSLPSWFLSVLVTLVVTNSGLNPIIYGLRFNEFKRAFWSIFRPALVEVEGTSQCPANWSTFESRTHVNTEIEQSETRSTV